MVPKYRSTNVYTSQYIRHHTVQCEVRITASVSESGAASRVAHGFGSGKLYICLSNKCFKVYPVYSLCTDVRPSQDHRILRMQTVQINLAGLPIFSLGIAIHSLPGPAVCCLLQVMVHSHLGFSQLLHEPELIVE